MENLHGGAKTIQQLADEYGVCRKTFSRLLKKKQIKLDRGLIFPKDQENIYNQLGMPKGINYTNRYQ
jgi:hypothetical protein